VFINDILIYSKTMQDHVIHLQQVLQILRSHSLTAKRNKCALAIPQIEYLGHVISAARVGTNPTKVESIKDWTIP
jgi:hypothetical protein